MARKCGQIRLFGIGCPETTQLGGEHAAWFTANMVAGQTVTVTQVDIAHIHMAAKLIRSGFPPTLLLESKPPGPINVMPPGFLSLASARDGKADRIFGRSGRLLEERNEIAVYKSDAATEPMLPGIS